MTNAYEKPCTSRDLARYFGLSVGTIRAMTRNNQIPHIKLGKKSVRYNLSAVLSALSSDK